MLLFGGNLTGVEANGSTSNGGRSGQSTTTTTSNAPARADESPSTLRTPHTDVLHRLTNHELRLLDELERTRSKLHAEWRVKLTELQRDEPAVAHSLFQRGPPTVDQLTQLFLVPTTTSRPESSSQGDREVQAMMRTRTMALTSSQRSKQFLPHKKVRVAIEPQVAKPSLNREPSLPRIRTNVDVLPILTTAAETAFEVGLDGPPLSLGSSMHSPPHQHVLPIFRLPTVNVNATAAAIAAKEIEAVEDDRERKQASETLGLSMEEIAMLEAKLHGHAVVSPSNHRRALGPTSTSKAPSLPGLPSKKHSVKQRAHRPMKKISSTTTKSRRQHDPRNDHGDALRKELESALHSVQHLTRLVKADLSSAQKICPASELRTSLYFKRWGKEKVEAIFRRLLFNFQGIAFERWKLAVAADKQHEQLQVYLLYKGSKKLDRFFQNWTQRKLRQAWTTWYADLVHTKALERATCELDAIRVLQRAVRGYRGRVFARLLRQQQRFARETAAATKIQRLFRGNVVRNFVRLKQLTKRRDAAATRIQALGRGYIARQFVRHRYAEQRRHLAASRLQALYRGRKTRQEMVTRRHQQRVTTAAILIQRRYRGRLGHLKYLRQQMERHRAHAATRIQTLARGFLARRLRHRLREDQKAVRAMQNAAATTIQKVYRGHRARLGTELKLLALREKNKLRRRAATKIQTLARCRQARRTVSRLRDQRLSGMVAMARLWVEYWSEDTSQWFYFNTESGDAIWAPPSTGYTKTDGQLVLQSGKLMENPMEGERGDPSLAFPPRKMPAHDESPTTIKEAHDHHHQHHHVNEEEDEEDEDRMCVECEEEDALRKCDQCEDVYCDACYQKIHRSAKRDTHTWKAIGTMRCIECEKMKATRWCMACQDPYCLGCFTIIHAKGHKVHHEWTDMATFRKQTKKAQAGGREAENAQTYDEFVQSVDYQYVTELSTEEAYDYTYPDPYASPGVAAAAPGGDEWTTQYDENSGQYYYYHAATGESRWA